MRPVVVKKCQHTKAALKAVLNSIQADDKLKLLCTSLLGHVDVEVKSKPRYRYLRSNKQGVSYSTFYDLDLSKLDESLFRGEILPDHWNNAWDQTSLPEGVGNTLTEDIKQFVGQLLTWNNRWSPQTYSPEKLNTVVGELNQQCRLLDSAVNRVKIASASNNGKQSRDDPKLDKRVDEFVLLLRNYDDLLDNYGKRLCSKGRSAQLAAAKEWKRLSKKIEWESSDEEENKSSDEEIGNGKVLPKLAKPFSVKRELVSGYPGQREKHEKHEKHEKTLTEADAWQLNKFTVALMLVSGVLACWGLCSQTPEYQAQPTKSIASAQPVEVTAENQSDSVLEFIVWMVLAGIYSLASPDTSAELASATTQALIGSFTRSGLLYNNM